MIESHNIQSMDQFISLTPGGGSCRDQSLLILFSYSTAVFDIIVAQGGNYSNCSFQYCNSKSVISILLQENLLYSLFNQLYAPYSLIGKPKNSMMKGHLLSLGYCKMIKYLISKIGRQKSVGVVTK